MTAMIDDKYKGRYQRVPGVKTASGRAAVDCGDEVAVALRGLDLEGLEKVASVNGMLDKWKSWETKSPGQRRMNLGNALRQKLKRTGEIVVP